MKAEEVITLLKANLPRFTSAFSEAVNVVTLTQAGGVATATTAAAHGLTSGALVTIVGALTPVAITTLTQAGGIASAETAADHDLTEGFQLTVEIRGATETAYNGTFTLLTVPNRRNFTFKIDPGAPATATGVPELLEDKLLGFNGLVAITVTSTTVFTYSVDSGISSPAGGTIVANTEPRVSGAATAELAIRSYTDQNLNDLWAFVVLGPVVANKERDSDKDVIADISRGADVRQFLVSRINVLVFVPIRDSLAQRESRDLMEDIFPAITQSIGNLEFTTNLPSNEAHSLVFVQHQAVTGAENLVSAYIHSFLFEQPVYLNRADLAVQDESVAFRDIFLTLQDDATSQPLTGKADLDDVPL